MIILQNVPTIITQTLVEKPDKLKAFSDSVMKFSDLLIASTSANHDEICFWEPKTLAPYEPMIVNITILKSFKIGQKVFSCSKYSNDLSIKLHFRNPCIEDNNGCLEMGQERTDT